MENDGKAFDLVHGSYPRRMRHDIHNRSRRRRFQFGLDSIERSPEFE